MEVRADKLHQRLNLLDSRVGLLLNVVTILVLLLLVAGLALFLVSGTPQAAPMVPLAQLTAELLKLNAAAFVTAGLIIVLLMPLVILITSFVHFIMTREKLPLIVCIILLVMLAASYGLLLK